GLGAVAYGLFRIHGASAYVMQVVVRPDARGAGAGGALLSALASKLREAGCTTWSLNVKPGNVPARRLYARFGLTPSHEAWWLQCPWAAAERLDAAPPSAQARRIEPTEDEAVERAFDLDPNLLRVRRGGGRVVLGIPPEGATGWRGVAVFDPAFPGASPFR